MIFDEPPLRKLKKLLVQNRVNHVMRESKRQRVFHCPSDGGYVSIISIYFLCFLLLGQIKPSESLFTYGAQEGPATFMDLSYVPMFIDNITWTNDSFRIQAEKICGNNINCLFDAAVTVDTSYGMTTRKLEENNNKINRDLGKIPLLLIYNRLLQFLVIHLNNKKKIALFDWRLKFHVWSFITPGAFWGKTVAWRSCVCDSRCGWQYAYAILPRSKLARTWFAWNLVLTREEVAFYPGVST